jgi:hypothetical protein
LITRKQSSAKKVSIIAITAALYSIFFLLSYSISVPNFTVLFLPIILLGVFPLWFGLSGLVGSMIGAFIGAIYVEALPLHLAWIEITTALVIYGLNWLLIPKVSTNAKGRNGLIILSSIYTLTLFVGTSAVLWQFTAVGIFSQELAWAFLLPTFGLNLPIVLITCPALIRAVSPKLRAWGLYYGNFAEFRSRRNNKTKEISS